MDARGLARLYAGGRIALGAGLLVAPGLLGRPWVGDAADGAGSVALRALGARDVIMGGVALHVVDHPQIGPRWMASCGVADAVDAVATLAVRRKLPASSLSVVAIAATGAALGAGLMRALRES